MCGRVRKRKTNKRIPDRSLYRSPSDSGMRPPSASAQKFSYKWAGDGRSTRRNGAAAAAVALRGSVDPVPVKI